MGMLDVGYCWGIADAAVDGGCCGCCEYFFEMRELFECRNFEHRRATHWFVTIAIDVAGY